MKIKQFLFLLILFGLAFISQNTYSMRYFSDQEDRLTSEVANNLYKTLKIEARGDQQRSDFLEDNEDLIINIIKPTIMNAFSHSSFSQEFFSVSNKRLAIFSKNLGTRICNILSQNPSTQQLRQLLVNENLDDLRVLALNLAIRDTIYDEIRPSKYCSNCKTISKGCFALGNSIFLFLVISGLFYPETRANSLFLLKYLGIPFGLWQLDLLFGKRLPWWLNPIGGIKTILQGCTGFCRKGKLQKEDFDERF